MNTNYSFENLFRAPWELLVSLVALGFGVICFIDYQLMFVSKSVGAYISIPFFSLALVRFMQGTKVYLYRKKLLILKPFFLNISKLSRLPKDLYIGKGFTWLPMHRQRLSLLSLPENQKYIENNTFYKWINQNAKKHPKGFFHFLTTSSFLPFKPKPDIGGKPWIHGVGSDDEIDIYLNEESRKGHTIVFGETGVGKTILAVLLVVQDILSGQGVVFLDPKGDFFLATCMYIACLISGRVNGFMIVHPGFPELSAKFNPLSNYVNVSEVATRVTSAINAEGEGKQFKDFAWKFLNIVAMCLEELGEPITYKTLAFFVTKPKQLLLAYCDKILPKVDPDYSTHIEEIISKNVKKDKFGNVLPPMKREEAARIYVAEYIEKQIQKGEHKALHDSIIADLYHAAEIGDEYYGKITASLGPVFDKINKTSAGSVFSWEESFGLPIVNFESVIKRQQVVYICLDAQSNKAMADAVGQAIIADLVSLFGRLYKDVPSKEKLLYLHTDEFSDIVRDEFITLLNKARGAGARVTAYTQTVNDLGAVFGTNHDKAKMLLGNFSNMIMMRTGNLDTAKAFTDCLEEVKTRSTTPSTMANDNSDGRGGALFTTYNTDIVNEEKSKIIVENDLFSLPKGQAFMLSNGGELYKIRIPFLETSHKLPESFETLMDEVTLCRT